MGGMKDTTNPALLVIDRNNPAPLYHQVREALMSLIHQGGYREGDLIPTERELVDTFQVSRITVSRAIDDLAREGYLVTQQGKGTFVARPKIQRHVPQMKSFSQEMREEGHHPGSRLLFLGHRRVDQRMADALSLNPESWVWVVERVRLADDEPICVSLAYLNLPAQVTLTPAELESEGSLWGLLAKRGIALARRVENIQAVPAGPRESELLLVEQGSPLLLVEGTVYSAQDTPIEYHEIYNRGDRYTYTVQTGT